MVHTIVVPSLNLCFKVRELSYLRLEPFIMDSGKEVFLMEREDRDFRMVTVTKVHFWMARRKDQVYLDGMMVEFMKESSKMGWCKVKVDIISEMSKILKDNSMKIGRSENIKHWKQHKERILALSKSTQSKESSNGMTRQCMKVSSRMGFLMDRALWYILKVGF